MAKTDSSPEDEASHVYKIERKHAHEQSILNAVLRDKAKHKDDPDYIKKAVAEAERNRKLREEEMADPAYKNSKKPRGSLLSTDENNEKINPTVQSVKANKIESNYGEGEQSRNSALRPRTSMTINNINPTSATNVGQANMYPANMLNANPLYANQTAFAVNNLLQQQSSVPRQRGAPNTFAMSAPHSTVPAQGSIPRQRAAPTAEGGLATANPQQPHYPQGAIAFQTIRTADGAAAPPPQQGPPAFQPMLQANQWSANGQAGYNPMVAATAAQPHRPRVATAPPPKPAESILNKTTSFKVTKRKSCSDAAKVPDADNGGDKKPQKRKLKGWFKLNSASNRAAEEEEEPPAQPLSVGPTASLNYSSGTKNDNYDYDALSVRSDDQYSSGGMLDSFVHSKSGTSIGGTFGDAGPSAAKEPSTIQLDSVANMSTADSMFSFKGLDVQDTASPHKSSQMYGSTSQHENQLALERTLAQMEAKGSPKRDGKGGERNSASRRQSAAAGGSQSATDAGKVES